MKSLAIIKNIEVNHKDQFDISLLPKERQERAAVFTHEQKRDQFLAVEESASRFASMSFDIPVSNFCGGIGEKPYFKEYKDISVSRSYAGEYVVIAAERPFSIGVDCETIQKFDDNVAKYFFTNKEREYIETSKDKDVAFTLLWTRKESYIKCMGRGMDYPINTIDVTPIRDIENIPDNKPIFSENDKVDNHYINSYIFEKIIISICSEKDDVFPMIDRIYEGGIR